MGCGELGYRFTVFGVEPRCIVLKRSGGESVKDEA